MDAVLYYSMLNESFRIDAEQKIDLINISIASQMESEDLNSLFRQYQDRATDLLVADILPKDDGGWGGLEAELQ